MRSFHGIGRITKCDFHLNKSPFGPSRNAEKCEQMYTGYTSHGMTSWDHSMRVRPKDRPVCSSAKESVWNRTLFLLSLSLKHYQKCERDSPCVHGKLFRLFRRRMYMNGVLLPTLNHLSYSLKVHTRQSFCQVVGLLLIRCNLFNRDLSRGDLFPKEVPLDMKVLSPSS